MVEVAELQQVFEDKLDAVFLEKNAPSGDDPWHEVVALGSCMLSTTAQPEAEFAGTITAVRHFRSTFPGTTLEISSRSVGSAGLHLDLLETNDPPELSLSRWLFVADGRLNDTRSRQLHRTESIVHLDYSPEKTQRLLELIAEKPLAEAIVEACIEPGIWTPPTAPDSKPELWQLLLPQNAEAVQRKIEHTRQIEAAGLTLVSFTPEPPLANA